MSAKARIDYLPKRVRLLRSANVSRTRCCSLKRLYTKQKRETWPVLLWYRDCLYLYHISHICRTCQLAMYYIWFWSTCRYLAPLQSILVHVTVLNMMIWFYMIWFYLFSLWMKSYGVTRFKWKLLSSTFMWYCLLCCTRCSNFWVCGWNPMVLPFKWKLLSSTFLRYCLLCCLTILYVNEIQWCDHSNETYSLVFSHGAVCFQHFPEWDFDLLWWY